MKRNPERGNFLTVFYHNIFDYPLTKSEVARWEINRDLGFKIQDLRIEDRKGYYFLDGKENIIAKRLLNEKYSKKKSKIAKEAGKVLGRIPTVKFVGITGSLAMNNSNPESDIDLIIIAIKDTLWTTRLITYLMLLISGFAVRRPRNADEKDRLCLNMWMDEQDLVFGKRNIFTAHEIAQVVPLVNKDKTYEKLLWKNKWILDYWPKAVEIQELGFKIQESILKSFLLNLISWFVEPLAFKFQYLYMKPKITREVVARNRAFFHPKDLSKKMKLILAKLQQVLLL